MLIVVKRESGIGNRQIRFAKAATLKQIAAFANVF